MSANESTLSQTGVTGSALAAKKPFFTAPTAKVSVGVLAASITTLLLTVRPVKDAFSGNPEGAAALTTLIAFLIQYVVPERS